MSTQKCRLLIGGRIDRDRPLRFTFNKKRYTGFAGDTLASALLANGVRVVGRSFKYHRPRGIFSAGIEETNALVDVVENGVQRPNVRATMLPLSDGLIATSQHCWPSVGFDIGRILDFTHWLWPAGFYNKTFKWPNWHWYEWFVRRSAGLGVLPSGSDPADFQHQNAHCDVLIVGTGPTGLAEALKAGRAGADVLLVEQDREMGGSSLFESRSIDDSDSTEYLRRNTTELLAMDNVRVLTSATATGYYDHNVLSIHEQYKDIASGQTAECFWKVRAKKVILATGAIEQPLVFENNDRPGIMLAGAVRHYLRRYGVAPRGKAVIATNNGSAYDTALALHDAGVDVVAVVDSRSEIGPVANTVRDRGIEIIPGSVVTGSKGGKKLRSVAVQKISGALEPADTRRFDCHLLAMSGGWSPTVDLYCQAGGKLRYDDFRACFVPDSCDQSVRVVGAANGDLDAAGTGTEAVPIRDAKARNSARQWIDFLNDVTAADVELAARENFVSVEHLKRYTTIGMAADQGKTSNLNALKLLAELTDRRIADVGTTTFRPQFMPVTLGAIAGRRGGDFYHPAKIMPAHAWHAKHGAVFDDYGGWKRPACYSQGNESQHDATLREASAVRQSLGIFESSPLGKIEVTGPDAAEFLNRIYVNNVLTLKPGAVRYGLMLNENGIIIDDGVFARIDEQHFIVGPSSGAADRITEWLNEWHQCEWPDLKLVIAPATTQWAVITLAGPNARKTLQELECDIDLGPAVFPHMSIRSGTLLRVQTRIQRVSFSGELSFEVSVPANYGEALWNELMVVGAQFDICPYGIEASLILRIEKGYLHIGGDTDGTTNPLDVGFAGIIEKKTTDFVGKRSLSRPNDQRGNRRQLVGIEAFGGTEALTAGAHLIEKTATGMHSQGFVTSACYSPTLGKYIALGMLENGFARKGETVTIFDQGSTITARVVDPIFYDIEGAKLSA